MIGDLVRMRYELTELVSDGPVFQTYRARDKNSSRGYMVRLLLPQYAQDGNFIQQLKSVVRDLTTVRAPNVERIVEIGEHGGTCYLLSEGGTGQPLDERIKRLAPYSVPVCISLTIQILEALTTIHYAGFAHGELTASHILVGQDGKVTVMQPGMWPIYSASPVAAASILPGLAPYLAPEISSGKMPSPSGDVYAVGVILFELLTARTPFLADSTMGIAQKHLTAPVPNIRQINPAVPTALEEFIRKALSKEPTARYANAKAMLNDLRVMQEAIRLGRPLTWPIAAQSAPIASKPVPSVVESAPVKEGEKSAVSVGKSTIPKEKPARKPKEEIDVSDKLPGWLSWFLYLGVIAMIAMFASFVYWNLTKPKPIQVPNLVGMDVADAKQRLEDMNLTLKVSGKEYSDRHQANVILQLNPKPGADVRDGSFVTAVISGGSKTVTVPDLRGRTLDEARKILGSVELVLDENPAEESSRRVPAGAILKQIPGARTKVNRQTVVKVTISSNRERSDPNSQVTAEYELMITMPKGVNNPFVRVDLVDLDGARTIMPDVRHAAEDSFPVIAEGRGGDVMFKVFFDGVLVKQVTVQPRDVGAIKEY